MLVGHCSKSLRLNLLQYFACLSVKGARNLTPLCRAVDDDDVGGGGGMQLLDVSVWFLFFFCCSVLSFPNYLNGGNLLVP